MRERVISRNALKGYGDFLAEDEKSPATRKKYLFDVTQFAEYVGKNKVRKEDVIRYKEELSRRYAVRSANSKIAAMNSFFRFMGWADFCIRQFRLQKEICCPPERELTKEEYFRLVKTARREGDERLSLLIETICATGIRVSELPFITVEALRSGEAVVNCKGKTRPVFLASSLRKKLRTYAAQEKVRAGPIFVSRTGKPIDRSNIWRAMKALCDKADIPRTKVFPHNLRHLFARTFYTAEHDIAKLADVLGHTNINTTRIYTITTFREHQSMLEKLGLTP